MRRMFQGGNPDASQKCVSVHTRHRASQVSVKAFWIYFLCNPHCFHMLRCSCILQYLALAHKNHNTLVGVAWKSNDSKKKKNQAGIMLLVQNQGMIFTTHLFLDNSLNSNWNKPSPKLRLGNPEYLLTSEIMKHCCCYSFIFVLLCFTLIALMAAFVMRIIFAREIGGFISISEKS